MEAPARTQPLRGLYGKAAACASRTAPPVWAALSACAAFFLGPSPCPGYWLSAFSIAGLGLTLLHFPFRRRALADALLSVAFGIALACTARMAESARLPPAELERYQITSLSGSALSDARSTAAGNTLAELRLRRIECSHRGVVAEIEWPKGGGSCRLVTQGNAEILDGVSVVARRVLALPPLEGADPGAGIMFYVAARDLELPGFRSPERAARGRIKNVLADSVRAVSGSAFPLAQALLLGIRDEIDVEEAALFRDAGCAHILALSGQHLSILCMLASLLVGRLLKRPRAAAKASLAFAAAFVWIVGPGPSLLRALLMAGLGFAATELDRPQHGMNLLAIAFCLALLLDPVAARSLSFALSYCAMAGILSLSERCGRMAWRLPSPLASALGASIAAIVGTAPVSIAVFGRLVVGGLLSATLSGLVVLVFLWSILASSLLVWVLPWLSGMFSAWIEFLHSALLLIMKLGSAIPAVPAPTVAAKAALCLSIAALGLFVYGYPYLEYSLYKRARERRIQRAEARRAFPEAAMDLDYDSPTSVKCFLESRDLAMSKRFGQNFLIDNAARLRLYADIGVSGPSRIWEIGPGIGSLTSIILQKGNAVTAFEIDYGFARVLRDLFSTHAGFSLVEGDFIKTWRRAMELHGLPDAIFGNLPYNAALGIIADLLETLPSPPRMVFTVQKEAARRIVASPGGKEYSAFSVLCSSVCGTRILHDIGAASFWPQPRVTSSVVELMLREKPIAGGDRLGFSRFVRAGFSSRRKTLRNNLAAASKPAGGAAAAFDAAAKSLGIRPDIRAEALSPEALAELYFVYARLLAEQTG